VAPGGPAFLRGTAFDLSPDLPEALEREVGTVNSYELHGDWTASTDEQRRAKGLDAQPKLGISLHC